MSTKSLNLVLVTYFAFILMANGSPIDGNLIVENDVIVVPEGASNGCKTFIKITLNDKKFGKVKWLPASTDPSCFKWLLVKEQEKVFIMTNQRFIA